MRCPADLTVGCTRHCRGGTRLSLTLCVHSSRYACMPNATANHAYRAKALTAFCSLIAIPCALLPEKRPMYFPADLTVGHDGPPGLRSRSAILPSRSHLVALSMHEQQETMAITTLLTAMGYRITKSVPSSRRPSRVLRSEIRNSHVAGCAVCANRCQM